MINQEKLKQIIKEYRNGDHVLEWVNDSLFSCINVFNAKQNKYLSIFHPVLKKGGLYNDYNTLPLIRYCIELVIENKINNVFNIKFENSRQAKIFAQKTYLLMLAGFTFNDYIEDIPKLKKLVNSI